MQDRSSPIYDLSCNTCPLINYLQEKFERLLTPKLEISIDEPMVPFKGNLGIKQFICNESVCSSIKLPKLYESYTGYKFYFYTGKSKEADDPLALGKSAAIVLNLAKGSEHKITMYTVMWIAITPGNHYSWP